MVVRLTSFVATVLLIALPAIDAAPITKTYIHDAGRGVVLSASSPIERVTVNTTDGALRGTRVNGTDYFLGIPFAQPPIGSLRWKAPQPLKPWKGVRDAALFGPDCTASKSNYIYLGNTSEDCLYLNVFRPSNANTSSKLPVMVWLYGGSWKYGGSSFFVYDGAAMSRMGNVVIVTTNYRLGAFGYAAAPALQAEDPFNSTGNYGTQDQRAALFWIRKNIHKFGGDQSNVILFGQSAGGASVSDHVVMPRSNGLFTKIIIESGPPSAWTYKTLNESSSHFKRIATAVGCEHSESSAEVECMRSKNTSVIWSHEENDPTTEIDWGPTIDGSELNDSTYHLWQQGLFNNISAMMIGNVKDEGSLFVRNLKPDATAEMFENWINETFTGNLSLYLRHMYPVSDFETPFLAASAILTDGEMTCNSRRAARSLSMKETPSYLYLFTHLPLLVKIAEPGYGVMHSSEVFFVFRTTIMLLGHGEYDLANKLVQYWTRFAWSGNPNSQHREVEPNMQHAFDKRARNWASDLETGNFSDEQLTEWPTFDPKTNNYLNLNLTISAETDFISSSKCDFWDRVYASGCDLSHLPIKCNLPPY